MRNLDLRNHSDNELVLWIDNDEYLHQQYRKAVRIGNLQYVLNTLEDMGMQYNDTQLDCLINRYEEDIAELEKALEERNPA